MGLAFYLFLRLIASKPKAANGDAISANGAISGVTNVLLLKLVNLSSLLSLHSMPKHLSFDGSDFPRPSIRALMLAGELRITARVNFVGAAVIFVGSI